MKDVPYDRQERQSTSCHHGPIAEIKILYHGGDFIQKAGSVMISCRTAALALFVDVLRRSLGGKCGHKGQGTDIFIAVAVMFMIVVNFL